MTFQFLNISSRPLSSDCIVAGLNLATGRPSFRRTLAGSKVVQKENAVPASIILVSQIPLKQSRDLKHTR
jgi:hypothetical protein